LDFRSRLEKIAAARADGTFEAKRQAFNQAAQDREMDAEGNIRHKPRYTITQQADGSRRLVSPYGTGSSTPRPQQAVAAQSPQSPLAQDTPPQTINPVRDGAGTGARAVPAFETSHSLAGGSTADVAALVHAQPGTPTVPTSAPSRPPLQTLNQGFASLRAGEVPLHGSLGSSRPLRPLMATATLASAQLSSQATFPQSSPDGEANPAVATPSVHDVPEANPKGTMASDLVELGRAAFDDMLRPRTGKVRNPDIDSPMPKQSLVPSPMER
jgi:hypothetical protein